MLPSGERIEMSGDGEFEKLPVRVLYDPPLLELEPELEPAADVEAEVDARELEIGRAHV